MPPIYSGGLGILAGDHLKEASDLGLPLLGVSLMYDEGYFSQHVTEDGWQESVNPMLNFGDLPVLPVMGEAGERMTVEVELPDRTVSLQLWEVRVGRATVPLTKRGGMPGRQERHAGCMGGLDRRIQEVLGWAESALGR
jgi:starch phosphorylase